MRESVQQAKDLIIKAIKLSGDSFARSLDRKAPKKKVVPLLKNAKNILLDVIRTEPDNVEAIRYLAQVEEELCHFSSAIKYLEKYMELTKQHSKKDLARLYRLREHSKEARILPISQEKLEDLGRYIEQSLLSSPCDHTFRFTIAWAKRNGINVEQLCSALEERGGYCDCEVIFNVVRG